MHPSLQRVVDVVRARAENVVAGLLGLMFVAFIIQIAFRYFFNFPIGWTSELSVMCWLCMVLVGCGVRGPEREEIRFDLVAGSIGQTHAAGRRRAGRPRHRSSCSRCRCPRRSSTSRS